MTWTRPRMMWIIIVGFRQNMRARRYAMVTRTVNILFLILHQVDAGLSQIECQVLLPKKDLYSGRNRVV